MILKRLTDFYVRGNNGGNILKTLCWETKLAQRFQQRSLSTNIMCISIIRDHAICNSFCFLIPLFHHKLVNLIITPFSPF